MNKRVRITTLVENTAYGEGVLAEHGLAYWIEYGEYRILFDTGQSHILSRNARRLGIDLSLTDAIVISHGHYDHTGGLMRALGQARSVDLFLHPGAVEPKFKCQPGKPARYVGTKPSILKMIEEHRHIRKTHWTRHHTEICSGAAVTGEIIRTTEFEKTKSDFYRDAAGTIPDEMPDDQALILETAMGLVILLGCAHAGVVNTLDQVANLTGVNQFHAVLGGMHLEGASKDRIEKTYEALRRYKVKMIAPAHCTGMEATVYFCRKYKRGRFTCPVGSQFTFA
jgi:7,8-dihydropterin-6-yl-methyl-4-(beta-D-ribofuranosyl)aminobenzene 5'-phosphate synthase